MPAKQHLLQVDDNQMLGLPARLKTSAAMGIVELTGLEMMHTQASGQVDAMAPHSTATMPALMLNRSSRVIPGLRGTPAAVVRDS